MAELLVDVLGRLRPHAVPVRIVRAPHQRLHAHVVDELGADAVELEGRLALAAPVVARLHLQAEVVEAVLPLEVHAVEGIGHPADAALSEGDADARIALEDGAADDGGQDVDEVHLEGGDHGEEGGPADPALGLVEHARIEGREGVEVERQPHVVDGLPEWLPHGMPHGLHVPRAGQLHASQSEPGHTVDLLHGGVDVAIGQARESDEAAGIVAAEIHEPVVVDAEHLRGRLVIAEARGRAENAVHHLGLDAVAVHVLGPERGVRDAADALLAVIVETGGGHDVHPVMLAGDIFLAGRPHAVDEAEGRAVLARPERAVRPVRGEGHAVLERRRGVRGEQIRRHPGQVEVAVGGNPRVAHVAPPR